MLPSKNGIETKNKSEEDCELNTRDNSLNFTRALTNSRWKHGKCLNIYAIYYAKLRWVSGRRPNIHLTWPRGRDARERHRFSQHRATTADGRAVEPRFPVHISPIPFPRVHDRLSEKRKPLKNRTRYVVIKGIMWPVKCRVKTPLSASCFN